MLKRFAEYHSNNRLQLLFGSLMLMLLWIAPRTDPVITSLFYLSVLLIVVAVVFASWAGTIGAISVVSMPLASMVAIPHVPAVSILFAVAMTSITVFRWRREQINMLCASTWLRQSPFVVLALFAILILFISNSLRDIISSAPEHRQWGFNLLRYWLGFTVLGFLVALDRRNLQSFFDLLPLFGMITVVLYIPLSEVHRFLDDAYKWCEYSSGINLGYGSLNPNTLGYLCALLGVLSFIRGVLSINRITKLVYILLFWLLAIVAVLTYSRGAALSLLAGIIVVVVLPIGKLARIQASLVLAVGASVLFAIAVAKPDAFPCTLKARYAELFQPLSSWKSGSYALRSGFAYHALSSIEHKNDTETVNNIESLPQRRDAASVVKELISAITRGSEWRVLFGSGPTAGKVGIPLADGTLNLVGSHNLFIDLLIESGLLGLLVFVVSSVTIATAAIRQLVTRHDGKALHLLVSYCAIWAMVLVQENLSGGTQGADWFPVLLGMGAALALPKSTDEYIPKLNL